MTNGEKIKETFPNMRITVCESYVQVIGEKYEFNNTYPLEWWNAEYKEPTIQESQAESDKFDAAFQDGYNNGYAQARFDYEQDSTTKNDLGVECISRADALDCVNWGYSFSDIYKKINELPSVTPQEPRKGHWITKIKSDLRGDMWPTNPKCSECGGEPYYSNTIYSYKFCPYCGAKMIEPQKSEDKE